jgi:hypothetical protein
MNYVYCIFDKKLKQKIKLIIIKYESNHKNFIINSFISSFLSKVYFFENFIISIKQVEQIKKY